MSSSIPGLSLSCRLKLDTSNPSTSSNSNMCSAWSLNPLIAFEISDHTAGSSALSGLRFSISIMRFGADMITSYFPSESKVTIAYTNFNLSGRHAYPGDSANTTLGVTLVNDPSFVASTTSPIDSRISFIAGHTAFSAIVGSPSLLRKPLLCRWSLVPANTIATGLIHSSQLMFDVHEDHSSGIPTCEIPQDIILPDDSFVVPSPCCRQAPCIHRHSANGQYRAVELLPESSKQAHHN